LKLVSRDVGLTSKLIYDVVMHTAPVVFACNVSGHLQVLSSFCCFTHHFPFYYVPQQWIALQDVPHPSEFAVFNHDASLSLDSLHSSLVTGVYHNSW